MQLVVFAGQSNAVGFGMTQATLPAHLVGFNFGQTYIWSNELGHWGVLAPGVNTGTAANPQAWGPEAEFAYRFRLANPSEILLIVKSAKGSTSLAQESDLDWSPSSGGELFDLTADRIAAARASIGAPAPSAVFWMQGEDDALVAAEASAYAANLTDFLAAVRAEWMGGVADGYVGLGRIGDSAALPHSLAVRQAQWQVDQDDASAESFKTIGFGMQADGIHLSAVGQVQLGAAFFDAWAF